MKSLALGLVLVSGVSFAAEPLNVTVKNFNFSYKDPHGDGSATSFTRNQLVDEEVHVAVDRIDKDLKFSVTGSESHEFELKDAPSFMTEAETMSVNGFNLSLLDRVVLTLASGRFNSKDDSMKLDGLSLDCARDLTKTEIMDQLLAGCIQKMTLKSSKFSSQAEEGFVSLLSTSISSALSDKGDLGINSLNLKTNAGKYDLSADVKSSISGTVKSNGNMSYDEKAGKLTLKISEVKFGILNITGKVFDELKKKESEKMKVKEPYVYYTLK
jgi:hypothetical protein